MKATPPTTTTARAAWVVVGLAGLMVLISSGTSRSFGLFLPPVTEELGTGREVYSFALAIQNILFGLPLAGILADKIGARKVLFGASALFGGGLLVTSQFASVPGLYVGLALMVGLALSGTGFVVALGAVGRVVSPERRSTVFGLVTASGSAGIFVMASLSQRWIDGFGWQTAMAILGVIFLVMAVVSLRLPTGGGDDDLDPSAVLSLGQAVDRARRSRSYVLLVAGFFVCGFHVSFIANHLPAFLQDGGLEGWVAATALGLIGIFNIGGSLLFGHLGGRIRKRTLLSIVYSSRAVLMVVFLLVPLTTLSALVFSAVIGFIWLATVPLTSGIVAAIFGTRYLSTLYGIVFLGHQLGAFLGVWLGGRVFDSTGSYDTVWMIAIGLGVASALIHLPIKESPMAMHPSPATG
jgi:predicted MFS family arabinose efflux permease